MGLVGVKIEAAVDCASCARPIPLRGVVDRATCGACGAVAQVSSAAWQSALSEPLAEVTGAASDEVRAATGVISESGTTLRVWYARNNPRCTGCGTEIPAAALYAARVSGAAPCAACGLAAPARAAPGWFADVVPLPVTLLGESAAPFATEDGGLAIYCIQCGRGLRADGTRRAFQCEHCAGQVYLPDDLWARVRPVDAAAPWYAVLDLGDAVGILEAYVADFVDLALAPGGNVVVAYHDDDDMRGAGHPCRIASVDARGLLVWVQDAVEFSQYATLGMSPADGTLRLVDGDRAVITSIDPGTGAILATLPAGAPPDPKSPASIDVRGHRGVAADVDGTFVVCRCWDDEEPVEELRRFASDGTPVPMWPGVSRAARFLDRVRDALTDATESRPGWEALEDGVSIVPDYATLMIGWDGVLYLVGSDGTIARYERDGTLVDIVKLPADDVATVRASGADRAGNLYVLFEHAEHVGGAPYAHVMRVSARGQQDLWLGPLAPRCPSFLHRDDDRLDVAPDGTLCIGAGMTSLRVIAPDRRTLWRSPATVLADARRIEDLEHARAKKRQRRPR